MARVGETNCSLTLMGLALTPVKTELKGIGLYITTIKIADIQFWGGGANKADDSTMVINIDK